MPTRRGRYLARPLGLFLLWSVMPASWTMVALPISGARLRCSCSQECSACALSQVIRPGMTKRPSLCCEGRFVRNFSCRRNSHEIPSQRRLLGIDPLTAIRGDEPLDLNESRVSPLIRPGLPLVGQKGHGNQISRIRSVR